MIGKRALLAGIAAVAATAAQAGSAMAATVAVEGDRLVYSAPGRNANDLRVARGSGVFTVRDAAAPLRPGGGCTAVTANRVTCPAAGLRRLVVGLGLGADRALLRGPLRLLDVRIGAGRGADQIQTTRAPALVRGGFGADRLIGGDNGDVLLGERGADVIRGGHGADRVAGGPGDDLVIAGAGPDRGFGGADDDLVYGKRGDDELRGGRGEDIVADFFGLDRLFGERGEDYLNTFELVDADGEPGDFLHAGRGPDYGCRASPGDVLVECDEDAKEEGTQ
jgi:hypothetical protein